MKIQVHEFIAVCRVIGVNPLDCFIPAEEVNAYYNKYWRKF